MVTENSGTFTMFDASSGAFISPNENATYEWPDNEAKVVNWNTWMKAFSYWLREKFDFDISAGPGTSIGMIGCTRDDGVGTEKQAVKGAGMDNDWTNNNEKGLYGLFPIDNNYWKSDRAESPFRPYEENGKYYYTDGTRDANDELIWTGLWTGENIYDDQNDRFDIILNSSTYGNLGFRVKYPLTCTGIKRNIASSSAAGTGYCNNASNNNAYFYHVSLSQIYYSVPGLILTLNKNQIFRIDDTTFADYNNSAFGTYPFYTDNTYWGNPSYSNTYRVSRYFGYGSSTLLGHGGKLMSQSVSPNWNSSNKVRYVNLNYTNDSTTVIYPWTPEILAHCNHNIQINPKSYNKINFIKSCLNNDIIISIIDSADKILLQFIIYKTVNNKYQILVAETDDYPRNQSYYWYSEGSKKYAMLCAKFVGNERYGNLGNMVASNDIENNFEAKPHKYFKDVRDGNSLIDTTGQWKLEQFCGMPSSGDLAQSVFLVTKVGTNTPIGPEGKVLTCQMNNKKIKFKVICFNGSSLGEVVNSNGQVTDTSYLLAIPIEQEE